MIWRHTDAGFTRFWPEANFGGHQAQQRFAPGPEGGRGEAWRSDCSNRNSSICCSGRINSRPPWGGGVGREPDRKRSGGHFRSRACMMGSMDERPLRPKTSRAPWHAPPVHASYSAVQPPSTGITAPVTLCAKPRAEPECQRADLRRVGGAACWAAFSDSRSAIPFSRSPPKSWPRAPATCGSDDRGFGPARRDAVHRHPARPLATRHRHTPVPPPYSFPPARISRRHKAASSLTPPAHARWRYSPPGQSRAAPYPARSHAWCDRPPTG